MIEIKENLKNNTGFNIIHTFDSWKVAFITYSNQYDELNVVKRHTQTDEAFMLIKGEAVLFTADGDDDLITTRLEKEKLYIIKKNTWHHLQVSEDALLVVMENSNTSKENTQSREIKKEQTK